MTLDFHGDGLLSFDAGAVKIYVIQYQETDPNLSTLLKAVATQPEPSTPAPHAVPSWRTF